MATYSRRGIHGRVVHDIGIRILRGELPPGSLIETDALLEEYDVSRTVLRESLKVLSAKGLVDALPKRGTIVRQRSHWNLLDPDIVAWQFEGEPDSSYIGQLNEVRRIFEPSGARLAAERATEDDIHAIRAAFDTMRSHHGNAEAVVRDDLRLHQAILSATHNELLLRFGVLIEAGLIVRNRLAFSVNHDETYLDLHAAVVEAIARRDPDAAEAAMLTLITTASEDTDFALGKRNIPERASLTKGQRASLASA
jgi:DNA-binding FadR family transcriptional regulator